MRARYGAKTPDALHLATSRPTVEPVAIVPAKTTLEGRHAKATVGDELHEVIDEIRGRFGPTFEPGLSAI